MSDWEPEGGRTAKLIAAFKSLSKVNKEATKMNVRSDKDRDSLIVAQFEQVLELANHLSAIMTQKLSFSILKHFIQIFSCRYQPS